MPNPASIAVVSIGRIAPAIDAPVQVYQVHAVLGEVLGEHHAFVGDRARRHRWDVERAALDDPRCADCHLCVGLFADHKKLAFERLGVTGVLAPADEELADHRLDRGDALSETRRINRHVAPPEHDLPFPDHQLPEQVLTHDPIDGVAR